MFARAVLPRVVCPKLMHECSMTTSTSPSVTFHEHAQARIVQLDRPKALNALTHSMVLHIYKHMQAWSQDDNVKIVLIKGAGGKAFCAGGDVLAVVNQAKTDPRKAAQFFHDEYKLNYLIGTYNKPFVALINGITMGGGVGLSVHGKYRLATEKSMFAMPETAIGLFPDVGGGHFLPRLKGNLGMYLALTGDRLKGVDVYRAGIANYYVHEQMMPDVERALLETFDDRTVEQLLRMFTQQSIVGQSEFSLAPHLAQIDSIFGADSVEAIVQALEKDGSEWAIQRLDKLHKMSPTSLKVTFEQVRRGKSLSLKEVLHMEYTLALNTLIQGKDFFEGVRAVLVDKDNCPKWDPVCLAQVNQAAVQGFFTHPEGQAKLDVTAPIEQLPTSHLCSFSTHPFKEIQLELD